MQIVVYDILAQLRNLRNQFSIRQEQSEAGLLQVESTRQLNEAEPCRMSDSGRSDEVFRNRNNELVKDAGQSRSSPNRKSPWARRGIELLVSNLPCAYGSSRATAWREC